MKLPLTALSLPAAWRKCHEHVVLCENCEGTGLVMGWDCPKCQRRGIRWNGVSIPKNMELRGYRVEGGECWFTPSGSTGSGFPLAEAQTCANIDVLCGPVVPVIPAPLHLLDRRSAEDQAAGVAMVGGLV